MTDKPTTQSAVTPIDDAIIETVNKIKIYHSLVAAKAEELAAKGGKNEKFRMAPEYYEEYIDSKKKSYGETVVKAKKFFEGKGKTGQEIQEAAKQACLKELNKTKEEFDDACKDKKRIEQDAKELILQAHPAKDAKVASTVTTHSDWLREEQTAVSTIVPLTIKLPTPGKTKQVTIEIC